MRLKNNDEVKKVLGDECRKVRINDLELTLQELSNKTGTNLKTLSGFENGRSTNFYIFYIYYSLLTNRDDRIELIKRILERAE